MAVAVVTCTMPVVVVVETIQPEEMVVPDIYVLHRRVEVREVYLLTPV